MCRACCSFLSWSIFTHNTRGASLTEVVVDWDMLKIRMCENQLEKLDAAKSAWSVLICLRMFCLLLLVLLSYWALSGFTGPYLHLRTNWLRNRHYNLENQCHWLCMQTEAPLVGGACSSIWLDTGHTPVSGSADRSQPVTSNVTNTWHTAMQFSHIWRCY